jgi:hypothetical protein
MHNISRINMYECCRQILEGQIKEVKSDPQSLADYPHPTIYHEFLKDPKNVPSDLALRDEAILYTTAGSDTVSDSFTIGAVNVIGNPEIHAKLVKELVSIWPSVEDTPRFEVLEKLPYLVRSHVYALLSTNAEQACRQRF